MLQMVAKLNYQLSENTFMSLSYQFNDERDDAFFNSVTFESAAVNLKSYSLLDFYVSHKVLGNKMTVFANVSNILNEDYRELAAFATRGRNVNFGFRLNL